MILISNITAQFARPADDQSGAWAVDMSSLVDEEQVRAMLYDTIEEELDAVGDHVSNVYTNLRMWMRLTIDKLTEIVVRVMNVIASGSWLKVRIDQTTERLAATYYVSSMEAVNDVDRLSKLIDGEVMNRLPGIDNVKDARRIIIDIIVCLSGKLKRLDSVARSVKPLSPVYELQWAREWKNDVLSPSKEEVKAYEREIEQILRYDETETRSGALHMALRYTEDALLQNIWGDIYMENREDIRALVKEISARRFNGEGEALDSLRKEARKYEWLMSEIGRLRPKTTDSPLLRFIMDDNDREKVEKALRGCADTTQVALLAKSIYEDEIMSYEMLRGVDFHRAIIPLLSFNTSETAIKQAIIKQVR